MACMDVDLDSDYLKLDDNLTMMSGLGCGTCSRMEVGGEERQECTGMGLLDDCGMFI